MKIAIKDIIPDPNQPRKTFEEDHINGLANSIGKYGFIAPITIRPNPKGEPLWMIVTGESRYKAAIKRGDTEIDCLKVEASDIKAREMQFVENYHRRDIPLWEQWEAWDKYIKQTGITEYEFAKRSGIPSATIKEGLLTFYKSVAGDLIKTGKLPYRAARETARIEDRERQKEVTKLFTKEGNPTPTEYAPQIVKMALEEPDVPAEDIERCVRLGIPEPPKKKERKSTLDLAEIMKALTSQFAKLSLLTSNGKLSKQALSEYAIELYDWRDSIEGLIKILEVEDIETH